MPLKSCFQIHPGQEVFIVSVPLFIIRKWAILYCSILTFQPSKIEICVLPEKSQRSHWAVFFFFFRFPEVFEASANDCGLRFLNSTWAIMVKQINCSHIFLNYTILGDQSPRSLSRLMDLDSFKESFTSFQQHPLCQAESMSQNCQLRHSGEIQWAGSHQARFSCVEAASESGKEAVDLLRGHPCGWQSPGVWRTTSCVQALWAF